MFVSVLGDSLSTFEGCQPEGYAVFYDEEKKKLNGLQSPYDMWWAKVNQALHAYLCVNNAFSGSRVTGAEFPAANSFERINALRTPEHVPDMILAYIGTNDFGYGVPLYEETVRHFRKSPPLAFEPAYRLMLDRLKKTYPRAIIACSTLMRTTKRSDPNWVFPEKCSGTELEAYNRIIRSVVREKGCVLVDICALDNKYETIDGFHATAEGHRLIASNWITCLKEQHII